MDTELFVIFPENKKAPVQTCVFTEDAGVLGKDDIKECFSIILKLKQTFQYEKLFFFYDLNNIQAFCYPHLTNRYSQFNKKFVMQILLRGMRNWRPHSEHNNDTCTLHTVELGSNTISETAVRKLNHPDNSFSLIDCIALTQGCSPCVVSVNSHDVVVDVLGPDEYDFFKWICNNRKPSREYNWNSKHGENGKGNWKGESRLLGSREEAKQLLKNCMFLKKLLLLHFLSVPLSI